MPSRVSSGCATIASALACLALIAACGSSGTSSTSTPTPAAATPTTTAAPATCPTAATVGAALGITLPNPVGVPAGSGTTTTPLPAGAKGEACEYHAATYNVIIEKITNLDPSYIAKFSSKFPVAYTSVSGVGDQARSFKVSIGSGRDNEGVVATKGNNLVDIVATATPASLSQIEALVNQLL